MRTIFALFCISQMYFNCQMKKISNKFKDLKLNNFMFSLKELKNIFGWTKRENVISRLNFNIFNTNFIPIGLVKTFLYEICLNVSMTWKRHGLLNGLWSSGLFSRKIVFKIAEFFLQNPFAFGQLTFQIGLVLLFWFSPFVNSKSKHFVTTKSVSI